MLKISLKLEELAQLLLSIYLFSLLDVAWWWYLVLFFTPDIGMLGYLINTKIGAFTYNLLHHKGIAIFIYFLGIFTTSTILIFVGLLLFGHAAFDRIWGYGLKYDKGFKFTHLGEIGN